MLYPEVYEINVGSVALSSLGQRLSQGFFRSSNISFPSSLEYLRFSKDGTVWEHCKDGTAVFAIQGRRPKMEDRFSVVEKVGGTNAKLYAVFDGHGGEFAADYAKDKLIPKLERRIAELYNNTNNNNNNKASEYGHIITEELLGVDQALVAEAKRTQNIAGTTALLAIEDSGHLVVANVGDSRGVMCDESGGVIPLSFDHKPQQLKEHNRIKEAGGFITFNGVWRVVGILATSRAMGDYPLKERKFVVADPDILTFDLGSIRPQFILLASDGLWDIFTNEEAVAFVKDRIDDPLHAARALTTQAYERGSLDNITVLIVDLRKRKWTKAA